MSTDWNKNTNSRTCPHSESRVTQSAKSGSSWELRGAQLRRREGLADCSHLWARAPLLCHPTYRQMSSESAQFFKCSNCDAFTHRKIALFVINYSIYFKAKSWPSKLKPMNSFNQFFYYFFIWKLIREPVKKKKKKNVENSTQILKNLERIQRGDPRKKKFSWKKHGLKWLRMA